MTEISTNVNVPNPVQIDSQPQQKQPAQYSTKPRMSADEFWSQEKRKNTGLIERLYNSIKNITGLGVGSKKVEKALAKANQGEVSKEEFTKIVNDYNSSQESSAQIVGDGITIASSIPAFFWLNEKGKYLSSRIKLNRSKAEEFAKKMLPPDWVSGVLKTCESNKKMMAAIIGMTALNAGFTKLAVLQLNRIGSKEFKLDEKRYGKKSERNELQAYRADAAKRQNKKNRRMTDLRNFASGTINGLLMPVMLLGGIIGTPLLLVGNSLSRYFVGSKTDKNKSIEGYTNNLVKDILPAGLIAAGLAIPLVKKGNWTKVFNENIKKVTDTLSTAKLEKPDFSEKTAFSELEEIIFKSKEVKDIINSKSSLDDQINKLTKENIFAVKFKQISKDGTPLTEALRENCPATRTIEEAQKYINEKLGDGYKVSKLLGVGTIAETYLAKSPDGKEVCLKILKEGISEEKILNDKQKFIDLVKNLKDKTEDEKQYLLRNVEDLSNGILKEVDFKHELEAAQELVPYTKAAKVVKPIKVENGVYVMEKANGISLGSLVNLNEAKAYKEFLETKKGLGFAFEPDKKTTLGKLLKDKKTDKERLDTVNEYIKRVEARTPEFGDINLSEKDANFLIKEYMRVLVEQFNKVEKEGKVIHADIHPGNIFIDINALKSRKKGEIFTLIDTGNTVKQNLEQSMRAVNLTSYVKRGNVPDLAEYVLEGATLPKGMTKDEAIKKVSDELNKCFFDNQTKLMLSENETTMTNEGFLNLANNIMRKYEILPNDTQLNLNKARKSANNSLSDIIKTLFTLKFKNVDGAGSFQAKILGTAKDLILRQREYTNLKAAQEKANLKLLPDELRKKHKNNPNMLDTNSEKYITYQLKQTM